jgi:hypothetical protein
MTDDELDELVLRAFRESTVPMRYCDVTCDVERSTAWTATDGDRHDRRLLIEASVDRLYERGLLKDATQDMDWHPHWIAANPLDVLAAISRPKRRRSR